MRFARGTLDADDQHVLGEPALRARLPARDAKRMAFLSEQCVAAIARAEALDFQRLRKVHDEAALGIEFPDRVQALDEGAVAGDPRERGRTHPRHELHVRRDVGAVRDLHPAARVGRVDRAHAVGNDVHRPPAHGAGEQRVHLAAGGRRRHPVIVGTRVFLIVSTNKSQVLDTGDVRCIRAVQVAARKSRFVELEQVAGGDHQPDQFAEFGLGAVAPVNLVGARVRGDLHDPMPQGVGCVRGSGRSIGCCCHPGLAGMSPNISRRSGKNGRNCILACMKAVDLEKICPETDTVL